MQSQVIFSNQEKRFKNQFLELIWNSVKKKHIPDIWKDYNTTLMLKKGDRGEIGNWRLIVMGDASPKFFVAILADRIKVWARTNSRFSSTQKGFLEFEGCQLSPETFNLAIEVILRMLAGTEVGFNLNGERHNNLRRRRCPCESTSRCRKPHSRKTGWWKRTN